MSDGEKNVSVRTDAGFDFTWMFGNPLEVKIALAQLIPLLMDRHHKSGRTSLNLTITMFDCTMKG